MISKSITTCINFGDNCVDCPKSCIDDRRCTGRCGTCINNDCDNHPQNKQQMLEVLCYADELYV